MKNRSQIRKEWTKLISAGIVVALVLNSTVSIYAESGTEASPIPTASVEETVQSTVEPAIEPTQVPMKPEEDIPFVDEEEPTATPENLEEIDEMPKEGAEPTATPEFVPPTATPGEQETSELCLK